MKKFKIRPKYEKLKNKYPSKKIEEEIEKDEEEEDILIYIDEKKSSKQYLLNILGVDIFFPYEPYESQKIYMTNGIITIIIKLN